MKAIILFILVIPALASAGGYIQGGGSAGGATIEYLAIPDTIAVAVEREMNLWYKQIGFQLPGVNYFGVLGWSELGGVPATDAGPLKRSYRYTPTTTAAGDELTLKIFDPGHKQIGTTSAIITAVDNTGGSGANNVLFIGDSLIFESEVVIEVNSIFTADGGATISMVGTMGTAPNEHEGRGGWKYSTFTSSGSPFYIGGKLDFVQYCSDNSISGLDYVVINLGLNDANLDVEPYRAMTAAEVETNVIDHAKTLVTAILTGYPDCKIIIGIESTGADDLSPQFYIDGETGFSFRYYSQVTMQKITAALISTFDGYAYSDNVDVCHAGLWVDRTYGYPNASRAVSSRSTETELVNTNFIHPNDDGYNQMADAYYSHLRWWMVKDTPAGSNDLADSWDIRDANDCWSVNGAWFTTTGGQAGISGSTAVLVETLGVAGVGFWMDDDLAITADDVVFGVYIKNDDMQEGDRLYLDLRDNTDAVTHRVIVEWDASDNLVYNTESAIDGYGIVDKGNGWFFVWVTVDLATRGITGNSFSNRLNPFNDGPVTGEGFYIDGEQVEYNATSPGPYVQTTCP